MKQLVLVFLGGGAGSVLRYLVMSRTTNWTYPFLGTFAVNIVGSVLIGFLLGLGIKQQLLSPNSTLLLVTGFCGGFTTFSALSYENQVLITNGDYLTFLGYTFSSILFGISGAFAGFYLSRLF